MPAGEFKESSVGERTFKFTSEEGKHLEIKSKVGGIKKTSRLQRHQPSLTFHKWDTLSPVVSTTGD